jgi:hypothetical protein
MMEIRAQNRRRIRPPGFAVKDREPIDLDRAVMGLIRRIGGGSREARDDGRHGEASGRCGHDGFHHL